MSIDFCRKFHRTVGLFFLMALWPAHAGEPEAMVLSTGVSGVVKTVHVQSGDRVSKGDLLLSLDARRYKSEVRLANALLNKFRLSRDESARELERNKELYDRTVISKHDLQLVEIALAVAEADYVSAREQLVQAKLNLEYSELRAPFAGVVASVMAHEGMVVVNASTATPLIDMHKESQ